MTISYNQFKKMCYYVANGNKGMLKSLKNYSVRYYQTFLYIRRLTKDKKDLSVLSLGGGAAFVEAAMTKYLHHKCVVLDLPDVIKAFQSHYDRLDIGTVACEISTLNKIEGEYDIIVSFENIEHLPEAPSQYFAKFVPALRLGGSL